MEKILKLYKSDKTIFSFDELKELFGIENIQVLKNKLSYYVKKQILVRITRGIYSLKDKEINKFELANKIYSPSYISFFSALYYHSIIFQYQEDVYLAYKKTDVKKLDILNINLKCLKKEILLNPSGILNNGNYSIASKERAFLDTIYLYGDIHLDNIQSLDYEIIKNLLPIYKNKSLTLKVNSYFLKK